MLKGKEQDLSLQCVSLSAGLLSVKLKGNYKEMAPQMYLVEIGLTHRCGGDRCEEKAISTEGCQAE